MMITRYERSQLNHAAVEHAGVLYLSGIVADDKALDVNGQTQQICDKIDLLLGRLGTSKEAILTATVYMADLSAKTEMNAVWFNWLAPEIRPARTCLGAVLGPGTAVEIVVTAAVPVGTD
jgi:enamine deaminase RidA (YjgF/YER057c/UK114 family)